MACAHVTRAVMVAALMVGVAAAAALPSVLQVGDALTDSETVYECCGVGSCAIISGSYDGGVAELLMLGQWNNCTTAAEGWCILHCQVASSQPCVIGTGSSEECSYVELWNGEWEEITSSAAAAGVATAALAASTSPRRSAAIKAVLASIKATTSAL